MSALPTPGPWETLPEREEVFVEDTPNNLRVVPVRTHGSFWSVAEVCVNRHRDRENASAVAEATAQLIAAAPDMLAALEAATSLRYAAQQYVDGNPNFPWIVVRDSLAEWCELHDAAIAKAKGEAR